jgi:hypothetical protein
LSDKTWKLKYTMTTHAGASEGIASEAFRNRRAAPPEWPELLAQSTALVSGHETDDQGQWLPAQRIHEMYGAVAALDNETLEANRYYSFGAVLCAFARCVAGPAVYELTVGLAAKIMVGESERLDGPRQSLPVRRINDPSEGSPQAYPFMLAACMVVPRLPIAHRLLSEALAIAEVSRRRSLSPEAVNGLVDDLAKGQGLLAAHLYVNAMSGAAFVFRRAILAAGGYSGNGDPSVTIRDCMEPEKLPGLAMDIRKEGVNCAQLRMDEIRQLSLGTGHPIDAVLRSDDTGKLSFDRDHLRKPPGEIIRDDKPGPIHTARLACPALQVGMIPLVMGCVADAALAADRRVAARYAGS